MINTEHRPIIQSALKGYLSDIFLNEKMIECSLVSDFLRRKELSAYELYATAILDKFPKSECEKLFFEELISFSRDEIQVFLLILAKSMLKHDYHYRK